MEADAAAAAGEREAKIEKAFRALLPDFRKQADSLTLEGVRRALEKDMGLEKHSLDAHKKFIKQCVDKVFSGSDDDNANSNEPVKAETKDDHSAKEESEDAQPTSDSNKISCNADEQVAKSSETERDQEGGTDHGSGSDINEAMIKNAIIKRASYFRENSETLTLLGVRRTLEEDLKLQKKALDAYKSFITTELDNILQEPAYGTKKNRKTESRKDSGQKTSKNSKRARQDYDTSEINDSHCDRGDSDEDTKPKKTQAEKGKAVKKQKKATVEKQLSSPKAKKIAKKNSDKSKEQGGSREEHNSHSSAEEDNRKKRQLAPAYGKRVERFKSIIKSCGMSIAPSVYRRAKMAPESKREACLIKELEDILEKEGLSTNPSEKEIKAVKKRKEREKELEGIDMSNIITNSRRRSTSNFIPLPTPKIVADSDEDDEEDAEDDDGEANLEGGDEGDNDDREAGNGSADDAEHDSD